MSLNDHVTVQISAQTQTVSRAGFGVPLALVHHALSGNLVREYTSREQVVTDFGANHPAVKIWDAVMSQSPRPEKLKFAKVTNGAAQTGTIKDFPANTADADVGKIVSFDVIGPDGTKTTVSHTIVAGNTAAAIATAIVAAVDAITDLSCVLDTDEADFTADNVGDHFFFGNFANCGFEDTTVDLGYAAALSAARLEDDDFYGITLEHPSEANIDAVSSPVESLKKILAVHYQGTTADFITYMTTLSATGRDRTYVQYTSMRTPGEYPAASELGKMLPKNPGSATWKFKNLNNATYDLLTPTQQTNIKDQNGNIYVVDGGVAIVQEGVAVSGEFMDTTRFIDWLEARVKERVFSLFVNQDKVDYDDVGVDQIANEIYAVLELGVERRGLKSDPAPTVTVPSVADIGTVDRAARNLPDVVFQGELRGAVHKVSITGVVTV